MPVAALVMIALAAGVRLFNLGGPSLWYDEAVTILLARLPAGEIVRRTAEDTLPPLSYLALHPWLGLGDGEVFWRFPSATFGVLTVALVIRLGRILGGDRSSSRTDLTAGSAAPAPPRPAGSAGIPAGTIVALSPFFAYYSQEVRLYALLMALAAAYCLVAWRDGGRRGALLAGVIGAAALYTHPLAGLFLPVPALAGLAGSGRFRKRDLVPPAVAALLFLPWSISLIAQSSRVLTTFWADPVSPVQPLLSLAVFAFGPALGPVELAIGLALIFSVSLAGPRRAGCRAGLAGPWPALLLTVLPPILLLLLSLVRPLYLDRVLIASGLGLALLVGLAWAFLPLGPRAGAAVVWIALAGLGLVRGQVDPALAKPPQREAAAFLNQVARPGDVVLHTSDGSFYPFLVYSSRLDNRLLAGDPEYTAGSPRGRWTERVLALPVWDVADVAAATDRVWLIVALDHSVEWQTAEARRIDGLWRRIDDRSFGGLTVREYAPRR